MFRHMQHINICHKASVTLSPRPAASPQQNTDRYLLSSLRHSCSHKTICLNCCCTLRNSVYTKDSISTLLGPSALQAVTILTAVPMVKPKRLHETNGFCGRNRKTVTTSLRVKAVREYCMKAYWGWRYSSLTSAMYVCG